MQSNAAEKPAHCHLVQSARTLSDLVLFLRNSPSLFLHSPPTTVMSRTRPPNPREWSRLQNHCTFLIPRTRTFLSPAINNHLYCKPNNHNLAHPRLLHTTSSRSAARPAPSTRKKAFQIKDTGRPGSLGQRLSKSPPEEDIPPRNSVAEAQLQAHLQTLEKNAFPLVSIMLRDGVLDKNVTPKKFKRIGATLLRNLYTLNTISPDVIRNIARGMSPLLLLASFNRSIFCSLAD